VAALFLINPRYEGLVRRHRLDDFEFVMHRLIGRRPGGHADRDVRGVDFDDDGGRVRLFVKREWKTSVRGRFMNWLAGYGRATRSRREWYVLTAMLESGIGCAEPVVYAERGIVRPLGYLILREIDGSTPLSDFLADRRTGMPVRSRRQLAAHLGHEVARMHEAGITHPDLYSKHIFLSDEKSQCGTRNENRGTRSADCGTRDVRHAPPRLEHSELPRVSFLDQQRGSIRWSVSLARRAVDLAALDSTLPADLASSSDRLTFLQSYLSHARPGLSVRDLVAAVRERSAKINDRAKIREMRELASSPSAVAVVRTLSNSAKSL